MPCDASRIKLQLNPYPRNRNCNQIKSNHDANEDSHLCYRVGKLVIHRGVLSGF